MWQSHIVREDFTLPYHAKPLHTQLHIALQQSPSLTNLHYTNAMNDSILYKTLLIFFFELTFSDLFFFFALLCIDTDLQAIAPSG